MKKKILALLTTLTLLISVSPAAFADGEATYYDAYQNVEVSNYESIDGSIADKTTASEGLEMKTGNAYFNINFGETAPVGMIFKSGYGRWLISGRMYVEVQDNEGNYVEIGYMDPFIKGGHIEAWSKERYISFNDSAKNLCTGNKSVRFRVASGTFGNFHGFKFFKQASDTEGIIPAYASAYDSLKENLSVNEGIQTSDGSYQYTVGTAFGATAAQKLIFEITRTSADAATLPSVSVMSDSQTVSATIPSVSVDAGESVTQYAYISNPEDFVGNMSVYLKFSQRLATNANDGTGLSSDTVSKTTDFKFINQNPISPYSELISEKLEGEIEIGLADFGELGAKSVSVTYEGSGDLSINGKKLATLSQEKTGEKINLDVSEWKGLKKLVFNAGDGLCVSSVVFEKMSFKNPFDKQNVDAVYIGAEVTEQSDWTAAIKEKLADNSTAYYNTSFNNTDVVIPNNDAEKLELIKNIPNGDIIFIQQSDIAEALVNAYAKAASVPYVIIVGTADYASEYKIECITSDGEGLGANETYKKPVIQAVTGKNPYTQVLTNSNTYDSKTMPDGKQESYYVAGFESWTNNDLGYEFKNFDFSDGASKILISYSPSTGSETGATVDVKIDGYDGTTIATFVRPQGGSGWRTLEAPVVVPISGIHNIYLVNRYRGTELSSGSVFGNIQYFQVVPVENYDEMNSKNALSATIVDENIYLDAQTTATFEKISDITELVTLTASVAANGAGVIKVKNGDTVMAQFDLTDAGKNFENVLADVAKDVSGSTNLELAYEGEGYCYVKNIDVKKKSLFNTDFGVLNYAQTSGANVLKNKFGGMLNKNILWTNVDFGTEAKAVDVTIGIAFNRLSAGASVTLYADSISPENKIGEYITSSQTGVNEWFGDTKFNRTFPLTKYMSGVHNIYVEVTNSEAATMDTGCDIFSFSFDQVADTGYRIYNNIVQSKQNADSAQDHNWLGNQAVITFMGDAVNNSSIVFGAAIYDSTNKLVDVDVMQTTVADGLNSASAFVTSKELGSGSYTYKYFVWDGTTVAPIFEGAAASQVFMK